MSQKRIVTVPSVANGCAPGASDAGVSGSGVDALAALGGVGGVGGVGVRP